MQCRTDNWITYIYVSPWKTGWKDNIFDDEWSRFPEYATNLLAYPTWWWSRIVGIMWNKHNCGHEVGRDWGSRFQGMKSVRAGGSLQPYFASQKREVAHLAIHHQMIQLKLIHCYFLQTLHVGYYTVTNKQQTITNVGNHNMQNTVKVFKIYILQTQNIEMNHRTL